MVLKAPARRGLFAAYATFVYLLTPAVAHVYFRAEAARGNFDAAANPISEIVTRTAVLLGLFAPFAIALLAACCRDYRGAIQLNVAGPSRPRCWPAWSIALGTPIVTLVVVAVLLGVARHPLSALHALAVAYVLVVLRAQIVAVGQGVAVAPDRAALGAIAVSLTFAVSVFVRFVLTYPQLGFAPDYPLVGKLYWSAGLIAPYLVVVVMAAMWPGRGAIEGALAAVLISGLAVHVGLAGGEKLGGETVFFGPLAQTWIALPVGALFGTGLHALFTNHPQPPPSRRS